MILLELALLGIRNFQQITRFEFAPGLNFVQGANGSGKTTLRETLLLGFFGQTPEQYQTLIHGLSRSTCQTAITFKTKNGDVYRLAKDFIKDIAMLFKQDPSLQKFIPIEKRKENVLNWFYRQCGGLQGTQIHHYFVLDRSRLPSSVAQQPGPQPMEHASASGILIEPSAQEAPEVGGRGASTSKQKRLQELKAMADKAEELFQLEEQLSDAQSRVGVLKRKLADLKRVAQEMEQVNEKAKVFLGLEGSIEQLQEFVEEFEEKLTERNREYQTLEEDRSLLEHQLSLIPTDPIYKNKLFIAGGVTTVLSFGVGLSVTLPGYYQHLYLLGLLIGLGLMATSVIVDMRWHSRKKLLEDKLHGKLKNLELLEARFRRENLKFFDLLKKTNTDSVGAFKEKIKTYEILAASRQRLLEERERILEGKDPQALQQEYEEKSSVIQELGKKIKSYHGIPYDLPSLRDEIRILEKEVASATRGRKQALLQPEYHNPAPHKQRDTVPTSENGHQNSIYGLLRDPLAHNNQNQIFNTAREIFKKLSMGIYQDLTLDPSSHMSVIPASSPTPIPLEALSQGTLDQVFLSLYLGLLMNLGSDYPFPLLLDDSLVTLDSKRQEVVLEILREISLKRQVILLSCTPYNHKEGDHQIRLP